MLVPYILFNSPLPFFQVNDVNSRTRLLGMKQPEHVQAIETTAAHESARPGRQLSDVGRTAGRFPRLRICSSRWYGRQGERGYTLAGSKEEVSSRSLLAGFDVDDLRKNHDPLPSSV
jgi:hypothetical protein